MTETFENNMQVEVIEHHGEIKPRKSSHISIREIVKEICSKNPLALENDDVLYFEYLKKTKQISMKENKYEIFISIPKNKWGKLTKPESTSRVRRELHHDHKIKYSKETEEAREKHQKEFKGFYHHPSAEDKPISLIS